MKFSVLLLITLFCCSCGKIQNDAIIANAETVVAANPDSALFMLQAIELVESLKDSTKANYWLALGQAHYNSSRSMADDSLLIYSMEYYKTHDNPARLFQSYKLLAQHKWWKNEKEKAYQLLKEGLKIAENRDDTIARIQLYKSLSNLADKDDNIDDALVFTKKLIELDKVPSHYSPYYNELGIIYYYLEEKGLSLDAFEKGISLAIQNNDSAWVYANMYRNYADILNEFGETEKAIKLQHDILNYYIHHSWDDKFYSYLSLSTYYLNLNKLDSANMYMNMAEQAIPPYVDGDIAIQNIFMIQRTLLDYSTQKKLNLRKVFRFSNDIFSKYIDKEKQIIEKSKTKQNLEQRNLRLTISKQQNLITFLIVSFILILIIGFFYSYIQKRRRILDEKEEELETLKGLLLQTEKEDSFFKRILLQQLGVIRLAATSPSAQNREFLNQMARITNKDVPVDDLLAWDDLYRVIDSTYNNFYTNLNIKFGDVLTDKEKQLCCLLSAGFSTKEISVVTQQSVRTIYQRKTTIRQKLDMDEKEDIVDYLREIFGN